jgi:hypothetical protein
VLARVCANSVHNSLRQRPALDAQPKDGEIRLPRDAALPAPMHMDDGHPYATCHAADGLMWWREHDLTIVHNGPDGMLPVYDWTGFRVDNQRVNGYECAWEYHTSTSQRCGPASPYLWCQ